MEKFIKDPDAVLDYTWDWSAWLAEDDTIVNVTFIAETGITVETDLCNFTTTTTTVWLSGGTAGNTYQVTARILTENSRVADRTIKIRCKEQ